MEETMLRYEHLLIGISCDNDKACKYNYSEANINCIINECEFIKYKGCQNTLVYSNSNGEIEEDNSYLCFDDIAAEYKSDRDIKRLSKYVGKKISIRKMDEAYLEYKKEV